MDSYQLRREVKWYTDEIVARERDLRSEEARYAEAGRKISDLKRKIDDCKRKLDTYKRELSKAEQEERSGKTQRR